MKATYIIIVPSSFPGLKGQAILTNQLPGLPLKTNLLEDTCNPYMKRNLPLVMLCPPVGDVTLRRLMPELIGERVLDGVVLLVGHAQDALLRVVRVARP